MTNPGGAIPDATSARQAPVALATTLGLQIFTSAAVVAPAALAPVLAADLGIAPTWIGVFVGLVYLGAMLASLAAGVAITRYGAIRTSQFCVLLCAATLALIAWTPLHAVALVGVLAVILGLGYGPITPASSQVLARTTPPGQMALVFSVKQTGVPLGAALVGLLLPSAALAYGWRAAMLALAMVGVVVALIAQATRAGLDADRTPGTSFSRAGVLGPLRRVAASPDLRSLSMLGLAYASVQVSLTSFLVVYLTVTLGWTLVGAGLALTFATIGGVAGRIIWSVVSDRFHQPPRVLGFIGLLAGCCGLALAAAGTAWPTAAVLAIVTLYGATAIGWNGVQLAQLARCAPLGMAGAVTGASGFITLGGVVLGPPVFAALAGVSGSYRSGFVLAAMASLIGAWIILRRQPKSMPT